ncbi:MAG: nuclear transport factor 2 family protein [Actinobacteria bacterium]|nr:nuclear transport factor 2 family protein [Actinomycetota bacterium]
MTQDEKLKELTDKVDLEDLAYRFFSIIDSTQQVEPILGCITEDGQVDYRDLGSAAYRGHDEMRPFFEEIFAKAKWQVHFVTNFHVTELSGNVAEAKACLYGKGCRVDTDPYEAYAACEFIFKHTPGGWKIHNLREYPVVPLSLPWAPEAEPTV